MGILVLIWVSEAMPPAFPWSQQTKRGPERQVRAAHIHARFHRWQCGRGAVTSCRPLWQAL